MSVMSLCAAVLAGAAISKQRGGGDHPAPLAILSKTGREVFVAQQQSGKGCLLVYDLDSRSLLDVYKVTGWGFWQFASAKEVG